MLSSSSELTKISSYQLFDRLRWQSRNRYDQRIVGQRRYPARLAAVTGVAASLAVAVEIGVAAAVVEQEVIAVGD